MREKTHQNSGWRIKNRAQIHKLERSSPGAKREIQPLPEDSSKNAGGGEKETFKKQIQNVEHIKPFSEPQREGKGGD